MSRIHEALKRAEQERVAGQTAPETERKSERSVGRAAVQTAAPPPLSHVPVAQAVLPHLTTSRSEPEPGTGPLRFDDLWAKCSRVEWGPNPNVIVFENADPFFPGTEQ